MSQSSYNPTSSLQTRTRLRAAAQTSSQVVDTPAPPSTRSKRTRAPEEIGAGHVKRRKIDVSTINDENSVVKRKGTRSAREVYSKELLEAAHEISLEGHTDPLSGRVSVVYLSLH